MPASIAADGLAKLTGLPSSRISPASRSVDAEQDPGDLGPPGADQAGEPDDLAGADRERDVPELADPGQALDLEQHVADRASRPSGTARRPGRPCGGPGRRS